MSATALPDYAQQLHVALQSTRDALLAQSATADANGTTALGAYDVSRRTFADARLSLDDALAGLAVATTLDSKLTDASLAAKNVVTLSTNADTRATAATGAVSLAATTIKAAAAAVDAVNRDVGGLASITKSNDETDHVHIAARDAGAAVAKVARAVEELKSLALLANVEAARPGTAVTLLSAQTIEKSVDELLAAAAASLSTAQGQVKTASATRTADLSDLFAKSAGYTIATRDEAALDVALHEIDAVTNASLALVNAPAAKLPVGKPAALQASCHLHAGVASTTKEIRFFAVPQALAGSFDFEAAHTNRHHATVKVPTDNSAVATTGITLTGILATGTDGTEIKLGQAYVGFFLRIPAQGAPTATDFSFATPAVTAAIELKFASPVEVVVLPAGAFIVGFENATPPDKVGSYELFFAPADVYESAADAEFQIASDLKAVGYTSIPPSAFLQTKGDHVTLLTELRRRYLHDMRALGGANIAALAAALAHFGTWARKRTHPFYVAYYHPFTTADGWQEKGRYTIGRYTDMYGDLFNVARRAYYALVLATGVTDSQSNVLAAAALTPAGAPFPDLTVDLLPTEEADSAAALDAAIKSAAKSDKN